MGDILGLIIFLIVTYFIGHAFEKTHFEEIKKREILLIKKPILSFGARNFNTKRKIKKVELVTGEVVISGDYFKFFIASFKKFFGGRLTTMESLLDRARREAILRMREKAPYASAIINAKVETVMLNDVYYKNAIPQCAVIAYGTAITYGS